jgi:nitroreductase
VRNDPRQGSALRPPPGAPAAVLDAIRSRRTHKHFTGREVPRAEIETLLCAAVLAPNHRMTEPWRFAVLGPESKRLYAGIRARVKLGPYDPDTDDAGRYAGKRAKAVEQTLEVPAYIAVLMREDPDDFRRGEDHAAVWMGVQNMLLAATALGLATKVATGRVFADDELRALVRAAPDERVLGMVHVGEPAGEREMQPRTPVALKTIWLD